MRCDRCGTTQDVIVELSILNTIATKYEPQVWRLCAYCGAGVMVYVLDELPLDYEGAE